MTLVKSSKSQPWPPSAYSDTDEGYWPIRMKTQIYRNEALDGHK